MQYPNEQGVFWFWPHSEPDSLGRRSYTVTWFDDRPHGQCFLAKLGEHIERLMSEGYQVKVMKREA